MTDDHQWEVFLYIYDMSKGMARSFSAMLIGKEIPGVWHTAIVAYDREYFFGGQGIESCAVGTTMLGEPDQILPMGSTQVPYSLFLEYLFSLGDSTFAPHKYHIFQHNCNNFTNELAMFLTGREIPREILDLPNEFLSTPLGQTFSQFIGSFDIRPQGTGVSFNQPQVTTDSIQTKLSITSAPKESEEKELEIIQSSSESTVLEKKESSSVKMSEAEQAPIEGDDSHDDKEFVSSLPARKSYKYDDPPIVFKDVDGIGALQKVEEMVVSMLNPQQQQYLKEFSDYLQSDSGAWAIGDEHIDLLVFLLSGGDGKFAPNVTLLTLEVLQAAALKEDVVLILHQDRKDHRLMSYINRIENLTLAEQEEIVKLLCNLCGQPSTFDWLLYISEWVESDGQPSSNSRTTVRAAVHTLLNEQLTTLQRNGVYLIFNLALKDVFEDVAIELSTAVLQYLHSDVPDDQALLCLTVIERFIAVSSTDVPALIKMLGPDLGKYRGKSDKIDKLIEEINAKVARLPSFS